MLCKAVLAISIFATYFFILNVSRSVPLCFFNALILHSIFAHHQVPFSLGVSWNKRTSTSQSNKLKLSLHITQTETYL